MKKNKKLLIIIGMVVLMGITLVGILRNRQQEVDDNVIRIGAILPLTGRYSDNGNSVKIGMDLATEFLNSNNVSNTYKVVYYDTKSEIKNVSIGFNKLNDIDEVDMFITTMSDNSMVLKPLAIKARKLLFCLASHAEITNNNGGFVFQAANTGADETKFISDYVKKHYADNRIFLYAFNTDAGLDIAKTLADEFPENLIGENLYNEDLSNLKSIVAPNIYKNANRIVVIGYSPYMGLIIKALREAGYLGDIFCNIGFNSASIISAAGDAARSVHFVDYAFPYGSALDKKRNDAALAKWGVPFTAMSYLSYEILVLLNDAITQMEVFEGGKLGQRLRVGQSWHIDGIEFYTAPNASIKPKLIMRMLEK